MEIAVVFTDLDSTLLEPDGRLGTEAAEAIARLSAGRIPVVPLTSKTESELRAWLDVLGTGGVGVFENGAGIVTPEGVETLPGAVPLARLAETLSAVRRRLGQELVSLNELPEAELSARTGLAGEALRRSQTRAWDLPFLAPAGVEKALQTAFAEVPGVRLVRGGAFWHLCGNHDKGGAVPRIVALLARSGRTVGLGDAPNDAGFLAAVDAPIVVPGPSGPDPRLLAAVPRARVAPAPAGAGWAASIGALLREAA
jgi:mannosyl-3-phosphoglycerate phosphatase